MFCFFFYLSSLLNWIASVKSPLLEVTAKAVQNTGYLMLVAKLGLVSTVLTIKEKYWFCFILCIMAWSLCIVELGFANSSLLISISMDREGILKYETWPE